VPTGIKRDTPQKRLSDATFFKREGRGLQPLDLSPITRRPSGVVEFPASKYQLKIDHLLKHGPNTPTLGNGLVRANSVGQMLETKRKSVESLARAIPSAQNWGNRLLTSETDQDSNKKRALTLPGRAQSVGKRPHRKLKARTSKAAVNCKKKLAEIRQSYEDPLGYPIKLPSSVKQLRPRILI
jgi:hypothetical protein